MVILLACFLRTPKTLRKGVMLPHPFPPPSPSSFCPGRCFRRTRPLLLRTLPCPHLQDAAQVPECVCVCVGGVLQALGRAHFSGHLLTLHLHNDHPRRQPPEAVAPPCLSSCPEHCSSLPALLPCAVRFPSPYTHTQGERERESERANEGADQTAHCGRI